jgi:phosphatidylserine/phosphatidylglycerophosphate/cardiolipin synthase-like enzyme
MVDLFAQAARLGAELPVSVASEIATAPNLPACLETVSPAARRHALQRLLRRWPPLPLSSFGAALLTAALGAEQHRLQHSLELVWTGPDSQVIPVRNTEQVLLSLIRQAQRTILLVSYAVFRIPGICQALLDAIDRGVHIRIVLDLAHPGDTDGYNPLLAIGQSLLAKAEVLYWPADQRPPDPDGRQGILHVKCLVADSNSLFLSSANFTQQALRLNMELGILLRGTTHPAEVERHFAGLCPQGILRRFGLTVDPSHNSGRSLNSRR